MTRVTCMGKVAAVLALDFVVMASALEQPAVAGVLTGIVALYVWLGGYIALFQEGAVACDKLPAFEKGRLQAAKAMLAEDVKHTSGRDISRLKLYLIPDDRDMQATAYGANCISVTRGTFENADPITLNAVLAHEISHTLHCDPEFSRGVFASIVLLMGTISMMSLVLVGILFLVFAVLSGFRSWLGGMVFQGTAKLVTGFFSLLQRCVVAVYQAVMGLVSRQAEYRSDLYSCTLGYGAQLAHFLAVAAPEEDRPLTITEALYRSHPPTEKRIARLEQALSRETKLQ